MNPSRGPASPPHPHAPSFPAVGHPPPAWQGSPLQTPDPPKPLSPQAEACVTHRSPAVSSESALRPCLQENSRPTAPLTGPSRRPPRTRSGRVSPLPQRQGGAPLPQREAVPRALRSRRSHAFLAAEGGACRFETALLPEDDKATADAGFLFHNVENEACSRVWCGAAIAVSTRQRQGALE